ncbi:MAG: Smr/MutS family protein [Rudaea sp.]
MRKTRSTPVSESDARLFADAVGPVRRLRGGAVSTPTVSRPAPEPVQSRLDEAHVIHELLDSAIDPATIEVGEELSYLKDGHSPRVLKQLKRGHFSIADEIDLHQMTAAVAREVVKQFLDESRRDGRLCVKLIHGKGLRSRAAGPVLKRLVDSMLRRRADVVAFASAKPAEGGSGATLVLLKRS